MRSASALLIMIYSDVFACKVTSSAISFSPERKKLALRVNLSMQSLSVKHQTPTGGGAGARFMCDVNRNMQGERLTRQVLLGSFRIQDVLTS